MAQDQSVNNILEIDIATVDVDTGITNIQFNNGDPSTNCEIGQYTRRFQTLGLGVDTPLPVSRGGTGANGGDQLYIKNTDQNAVLTLKYRKVGDSVASAVAFIRPQSFFLLWNTSVGQSVDLVSVASSVGATQCEIFQGVIQD